MKPVIAAIAIAASLTAASAHADVLFSNLGPGDSFNCCNGWTVSTAASPVHADLAVGIGFVAAADGDVSQIDIALGHAGGNDASATLHLWTSAFGSELGSWTLSNLPSFGGNSLASISGITGVHLSSGASYILVAQANADGWQAWNQNTTGGSGPFYTNGGGGGSNTQGAFRITGGAIPEPAAWALMLVGFGGLGAALRRRNALGLAA